MADPFPVVIFHIVLSTDYISELFPKSFGRIGHKQGSLLRLQVPGTGELFEIKFGQVRGTQSLRFHCPLVH